MSRARMVCLSLALVTLLAYSPVWNHGFVNYDDGAYLSQNPMVEPGLTWTGIKWAFTTFHSANWHPLTWLSHMFDCELFGLAAGGHHFVNVLLHSINAILLFLFLFRTTKALWPSALVAALFAWHPLRVESVAWAAERKDVLCACFGLLTLLTYGRYVEESNSDHSRAGVQSPKSKVAYCLALLCFALGLMAKPMLVTLPFVLLLLDGWPLQRVPGFEWRRSPASRLLLEKGPFLALAAASCVVTFVAQQRAESVLTLQSYPLPLRIENAMISPVNYLLKTVWPVNLAIIYPLPNQIPWSQAAAAAVALALTTWLAWRRRRTQPYLLVGWLWFLGMLVPVIGLVQVGVQAMADRYTYLPQIGLFIGAAFGLSDLAARLRLKPAGLTLSAMIVLAGFLMVTAHQLRFWRDGEALFARAIAVTRDNPVAHNNLGVVLDLAHRPQEAIGHYREALRLQPDYVLAHHNLALVLAQTSQIEEAFQQFQETLRLRPDYPETHYNFGLVLLKEGQTQEAVAHFRRALEIRPGFGDARDRISEAESRFRDLRRTNTAADRGRPITASNPGAAPPAGNPLLQNGHVDEAIIQFQEALDSEPNNLQARNNLGIVLLQKGRLDEAETQFQRALLLQPDNPQVNNNLGLVFLKQGKVDKAIAHFQQAAEFQPGYAQAHINLGTAFLRRGQVEPAVVEFQKVLDIEPGNIAVQNNLAWTLATTPQASLRNGARAVQLARQADALAGGRDPAIAGTLAAACAELGDFPRAIAAAERAVQLAAARNDSAQVDALKIQLGCYQSGAPFRDSSLTNQP
jgi:protein O-mannosyl-transferase